jgi:CheY-like chemotaxis protein/two-component sensor histidine kinase
MRKSARKVAAPDSAGASTGQPGAAFEAAASVAGAGNEPINILIVDDEPANLLVLETLLDDPGYRLVRASSAEQALLALIEEEFALLILDIRMPGMNGFELAQLIKERKKTATVPIIFLTAYYDKDQHVLEGYGTGAVDFLNKPVNPVVLRAKVSVFADLHRKNLAVLSANRALTSEVGERRRAEDQLRELNETLERRVKERTQALREAHEQLLAAEQAARTQGERISRTKDEFLASLSHELRTPLAAIAGWTRVLMRPETDAQTQRRGIEAIERNVQVQSHLVDDLLDLSRIVSGKLLMNVERVDLNQIAAAAADTARPAAQNKGVRIDLQLGAGAAIEVMGDSARLQQIASNLVINALKFTPAGGTVTISTALRGAQVELTVSDTGQGIAAEFLPHLFDRFSQADGSAARQHGGLGLGLSIVKDLVELHGGTVTASSAGQGRGASFKLHLPQASGRLAQTAAGHPVQVGNIDLQGLSVLLVDDDLDMLEVEGRQLRDCGAVVTTANSAEQALQFLRHGRFDVLLSDLGMPGMDGYGLIDAVRSTLGLSAAQLPAVAVTAYVRARDRQRALRAGFQICLQKPVVPAALARAVLELARGQGDADPGRAAPLVRLRALFVEDNADLREQIGWMLDEEGLDFVAVASGEDGDIELHKKVFDVVITDISLPKMTGVEFARLVLARSPQTWVVFSSGYPMGDLLHGFGPNVRALQKPFEAEELHELMNEVRSQPGRALST